MSSYIDDLLFDDLLNEISEHSLSFVFMIKNKIDGSCFMHSFESIDEIIRQYEFAHLNFKNFVLSDYRVTFIGLFSKCFVENDHFPFLFREKAAFSHVDLDYFMENRNIFEDEIRSAFKEYFALRF